MNPFFDSLYYLNKYPDIKDSEWKDNPFQHFKEHGYLELREPCDLTKLNWDYYKFNNFFIINNNNDKLITEKDYQIHFIKYGLLNSFNITFNNSKLNDILTRKLILKEIFFDHKYYIENNPDLKHLNSSYECINHYIYNGFNEKRLICKIPEKYSKDEWIDIIYN